ncbi:MAG: UvrB/UvrC motif-containing protein [Pirellulales bacterium]
MAPRKKKDIDAILRDWPLEPGELCVRLVRGSDSREVIQMRVEMGVLQLEVSNRPDGQRPHGADTFFDYLLAEAIHSGDDYRLSEEQCGEVDREFLQFYHRRICWLQLRDFARAVRDADHSLAMMDFVKTRSPSDDWVESHEQYRPFILFHRTQASALAALEEDGPEAAIGQINQGVGRIRAVYEENDALEDFDDDEMVGRLEQLKEALRDHFNVGRTLNEQLAEAIASEQYELAAKLRDEIARREV